MLPGLAGDAEMWRDQLPALAAWHPKVADVHMRHGTIVEMAAALLARHPGPLALCGASMGGMVAMEAVRQAPSRIRGLTLLGTTARPEDDATRQVRDNAIALFLQGRIAEVIEPNAALAFHPRHVADTTLLQRYVDFGLRAGAQQLVRQNRAVIGRPDARAHLAAVRCPTLVMCGQDDPLTPIDRSREIAALVPGARLVAVPECGHLLTMEQPQAVNGELLRWLERLAT
ncbi:MAG: alpha/beta fold hydrolase [Ramlibacter sp.]